MDVLSELAFISLFFKCWKICVHSALQTPQILSPPRKVALFFSPLPDNTIHDAAKLRRRRKRVGGWIGEGLRTGAFSTPPPETVARQFRVVVLNYVAERRR